MKKLDTITALACAVIANMVSLVDVTRNDSCNYELYDSDGKVVGWYAAMTNSGVNVQMGGRNINVRSYIEFPSHGDEYWGRWKSSSPTKKKE